MKPTIGISFQTEDLNNAYSIRKRWVDYVNAIGGIPLLLLPSEKFSDTEKVLSSCDGVLIVGGDDVNPILYDEAACLKTNVSSFQRDCFEIDVVKWCVSNDVPFLGICRGIQVANVAFGGTLYQEIPKIKRSFYVNHEQWENRKEAIHGVRFVNNSYLKGIFKKEDLGVNSIHHQCVKKVPSIFKIEAVSEDGIIEAISCPKCDFFIGVQWHPEFNTQAGFSKNLNKAFILAALRKKKVRNNELLRKHQ